jgi:His-Xaa-Ser system protein HxsD
MRERQTKNLFQVMNDGSYKIQLPSSLFGISTVKKAAYKFTGSFHFIFQGDEGSTLVLYLRPKTDSIETEKLIGDFYNELLDQDLRETIAQETKAVRDLILAEAFSKVSILHPEPNPELELTIPDSTQSSTTSIKS